MEPQVTPVFQSLSASESSNNRKTKLNLCIIAVIILLTLIMGIFSDFVYKYFYSDKLPTVSFPAPTVTLIPSEAILN